MCDRQLSGNLLHSKYLSALNMSLIWKYFTLDTSASSTANCSICKAKVSRGGSSVSTYNTTNLIKHLQKHHAKDIQHEFQMPLKRLQQDVKTRWNSTYYMIQSILEQKRTLCTFAADHELPAVLTADHCALLEKTMIVLSPFEELTRTISSSSSTTADVIPTVSVLKRLLSQERDTDTGIKTMKSTLLQAVNTRFGYIEDEPLYSVATYLDPQKYHLHDKIYFPLFNFDNDNILVLLYIRL